MKPSSRHVSWYGKLPSRGDFIGRGLPPRWRSEWDGWLQRGLSLAATTVDSTTLSERLRTFTPWRYLALRTPGEIWSGILAASHDRVGRPFPLTLAERLGGRASPVESAARLASLLGAARDGLEALEAAIDALPPPAQTEYRSAEIRLLQSGSLWWPLDAGQDAGPRVAAWPPEPELLLDLLELQSDVHQIASAE